MNATYPKITLLAPARDIQVAKAAIQAGADAVYIGAPKFGARQAAGNSIEDLQELVRYAHIYDVQILVTLNTLLTETEKEEAVQLAWKLYRIGVDALIIQDLTLLDLNLPPIRLHASTQCDNRTAEQVQRLQQQGFQRVVLARELSLKEIQSIRQKTTIELEAFIHGALCVCYSGKCFMSEVLMNRSANRGCCAQMCRMPYDLLDKNHNEIKDDQGKPVHQRYVLSLQDMDRSGHIQEMIQAGITTFKIEGRLKDAEYVTNIVAYYRQLIDRVLAYQSDTASSTFTYSFTPSPEKTFHRGATDYFLNGRTRPLANWLTPKSTGEPIGQLVRVQGKQLTVKLLPGIELHNGDGLCCRDRGFAINRINPINLATTGLLQINVALPTNAAPLSLCPGDMLFRNSDSAFAKTLHAERKVWTDIFFEETQEGFRLTYLPRTSQAQALSQTFVCEKQPADNPERMFLTLSAQLSKLGDTPWIAQHIHIITLQGEQQSSFPFFIPIGTLNAWRREALILPSQPVAEEREKSADLSLTRQSIIKQSVIEPSLNDAPLMSCRYCILYEMGHCRKENPLSDEPRFLRLANGTTLSLSFDCANCQMIISR